MHPKGQNDQKEEKILVEGLVLEALPDSQYLVEVEIAPGVKHQLLGYLAGRMKQRYIKVLPGDKVRIEISTYNLELGRIRDKIFKKRIQEPVK
ncbi:MAG: translation initiation factor IF-1 [Candidatus Doudnabacteria bacterium]|nr:translation initiation factor IF-1 [Candidatus Doudnabacteria bacterium]